MHRCKALSAAALLFGLMAATANAQGPPPPLPLPEPKVAPIQVTGPPAQRLNLIIMGDGYQKDQQSLFRARRGPQPRRSCGRPSRSARYRNYINVYAVEIASIDYGVRCDPDGRVRARRRHDPRHRRARRADRRQEHRAADDLPERLRRPARPRHRLRRRAGRTARAARAVLPGRA